jgi:hypothetical protein
MPSIFPTSQRELIRTARGQHSQAEFATLLGVERSSLSRYENEKIGAPVAVLNYCLDRVAKGPNRDHHESPVEEALAYLQCATQTLSQAIRSRAPTNCAHANRKKGNA